MANTYTSTLMANTPKAVHIGNNSVSGTLRWTAASGASDIGQLCKIPHGATIVDFWENHSTGATAQGLDFGFASGVADGGGANASILVSGGAQATQNRLAAGAPITISVSDNDPNKYAVLIAKQVSGSATTSLLVNFSVLYRTDGT